MQYEVVEKKCFETLSRSPFYVKCKDSKEEFTKQLKMGQIEVNLLVNKLEKHFGVKIEDQLALNSFKTVEELSRIFFSELQGESKREYSKNVEKNELSERLEKMLSSHKQLEKIEKELRSETEEKLPFDYNLELSEEQKTVICFPGQGSQYVGMAKDLIEKYPQTRIYFEIAQQILGYDLLEICLNGPEEKLSSTRVSQPAIFVCSVASLVKLECEFPGLVSKSVATAGLSLGEYTSLYFSGVLSFQDTLRIIKSRAELMQEASEKSDSAMLSLVGNSVTEKNIKNLVDRAISHSPGVITIANYLSKGKK